MLDGALLVGGAVVVAKLLGLRMPTLSDEAADGEPRLAFDPEEFAGLSFREAVRRAREERRKAIARIRAERGGTEEFELKIVTRSGRTLVGGRGLTVLALLGALAYSVPPLVWRGQTFGELLVGVRYASSGGRRLGPLEAILRHVGLPLATRGVIVVAFPERKTMRVLASLAYSAADALYPLVDADNRSISDLLAGTKLVRATG